jgi:hypothetical protein
MVAPVEIAIESFDIDPAGPSQLSWGVRHLHEHPHGSLMPATYPLDAVYRDRRPPGVPPGGTQTWQRFAVACLAACWLAYLATAVPVAWRALLTLPALAEGAPLPTPAPGLAGALAALGAAFGAMAYVLATWLGVVAAGLSLLVVWLAELEAVATPFRIAAATALASACLVCLPAEFLPRVIQLFALGLPFAYGVSGTWRAWRRVRHASMARADV